MNKKFSLVFLLVLLIFTLSLSSLAKEVNITIFHTNDTHSRVAEDAYAGMGFAKISTIVEDERANNSNVLLLDAGDTFHGQIIANLVKGESIARIYNVLRYDAMTAGNHDFNYGKDRLLELNEITKFPILAANVKMENDSPFLDAYIIKEIAGVKVAIIGLATPETTYKTHPNNVAGLVFADPVKAAQIMVEELKDNADVIVILSHLGLDKNSQYTSRMVAESVNGIDLIVDGHSHHDLPEGLTVNGTLIAMAGEYDKYLGKITLTVEEGKVIDKKAFLISKEDVADVAKDPEILQVVEEINASNKKITSEIVGKTAVKLNGERASVRTGETNLGNLITEAMLSAVEADVAITNGGGIRASIEKGEITKGDVITVLPFGNFVVVKELKGSALLDAVEHGISAYPESAGHFAHIAGMTLIFDPSRPAGERVVRLLINGQRLDYDHLYKVATNDFMAAGGDSYTMFADSATLQEAGGLEEIVIEYIKQKEVITPQIEGRIIPVNAEGHYIYQVKTRDTLLEIAERYSTSLQAIAVINQIKDLDLIFPGQEILIPVIDE